MKFQFNDGGRNQYTSVPGKHDCVIRAIAIAANLNYWQAYQDIQAIAPNIESEGVNIHDLNLISYLQSLGFVRVDGITAMQAIPEGRVIACTTGHYTAIVNGVIQDVRNEAHKAVSHYWVRGKTFDVYKNGKKLNGNPLNGDQAVNMHRLYALNYDPNVQLKAV